MAERCESRHPEHGLLCTLPAGHDTHRHVGDAWTTLDRLDGHVLVSTEDLADVLLAASGLVLPGTCRGAVDRLNAVVAEAVKAADDSEPAPEESCQAVGRYDVCTCSGSPEVWSDACAPGGWVCGHPDPDRPDGICGMPVETVPCEYHGGDER